MKVCVCGHGDAQHVGAGCVRCACPTFRDRNDHPASGPTRALYIHVTEQSRIQRWGYEVRQMFDETPYLVGSVTERSSWRDIDVRLMLDDAAYDLWDDAVDLSRLNLAISTWGQTETGLPIDFQIQRASAANDEYGDRRRVPLGLAPRARDARLAERRAERAGRHALTMTTYTDVPILVEGVLTSDDRRIDHGATRLRDDGIPTPLFRSDFDAFPDPIGYVAGLRRSEQSGMVFVSLVVNDPSEIPDRFYLGATLSPSRAGDTVTDDVYVIADAPIAAAVISALAEDGSPEHWLWPGVDPIYTKPEPGAT